MTILVVGDANADLSAFVDALPHEGADSLVHTLRWSSGGSAANTATFLAHLGQPVRLLTRVGGDPAAQVALRAAQASGVDLRLVQRDHQLPTGLCYAAISAHGERTFFSYRGANQALSVTDPRTMLRGVSWLHVSGYALLADPQAHSALALLQVAQALQIPTSLDLCLPVCQQRPDLVAELFPHLTILCGNETELTYLAEQPGNLPEALHRCVARIAGLQDGVAESEPVHVQAEALPLVAGKCGASGCVLASTSQAVYVPGLDVAVVDTTGCGDAWVAGFLAAWQHGTEPTACARAANRLGAYTATQVGAVETLPT